MDMDSQTWNEMKKIGYMKIPKVEKICAATMPCMRIVPNSLAQNFILTQLTRTQNRKQSRLLAKVFGNILVWYI